MYCSDTSLGQVMLVELIPNNFCALLRELASVLLSFTFSNFKNSGEFDTLFSSKVLEHFFLFLTLFLYKVISSVLVALQSANPIFLKNKIT